MENELFLSFRFAQHKRFLISALRSRKQRSKAGTRTQCACVNRLVAAGLQTRFVKQTRVSACPELNPNNNLTLNESSFDIPDRVAPFCAVSINFVCHSRLIDFIQPGRSSLEGGWSAGRFL